jgi:hypothetical protein
MKRMARLTAYALLFLAIVAALMLGAHNISTAGRARQDLVEQHAELSSQEADWLRASAGLHCLEPDAYPVVHEGAEVVATVVCNEGGGVRQSFVIRMQGDRVLSVMPGELL